MIGLTPVLAVFSRWTGYDCILCVGSFARVPLYSRSEGHRWTCQNADTRCFNAIRVEWRTYFAAASVPGKRFHSSRDRWQDSTIRNPVDNVTYALAALVPCRNCPLLMYVLVPGATGKSFATITSRSHAMSHVTQLCGSTVTYVYDVRIVCSPLSAQHRVHVCYRTHLYLPFWSVDNSTAPPCRRT